jgi:hypothetical protein
MWKSSRLPPKPHLIKCDTTICHSMQDWAADVEHSDQTRKWSFAVAAATWNSPCNAIQALMSEWTPASACVHVHSRINQLVAKEGQAAERWDPCGTLSSSVRGSWQLKSPRNLLIKSIQSLKLPRIGYSTFVSVTGWWRIATCRRAPHASALHSHKVWASLGHQTRQSNVASWRPLLDFRPVKA